MDLEVEDVDETARWVREHGGARIADHRLGDLRWRVMAGPEGNEFCLVPGG